METPREYYTAIWIVTIKFVSFVLLNWACSEDEVISRLVGGVLYLGGDHLNTCSST